MKRCNKIIAILIAFIFIIVIFMNNVYATPIVNPDDYDPSRNPLTVADSGKFIDVVNVIVGSIRVLGTIIAVIALVVIGIKYMIGSVEEKANFKETMVPYIIGAVMVFAIPNILGILYDIVKSMKM